MISSKGFVIYFFTKFMFMVLHAALECVVQWSWAKRAYSPSPQMALMRSLDLGLQGEISFDLDLENVCLQ